MSDTEYEKFEISDYDLESGFNPYRKNRKRPSKNQQIYGIWADNSDDEPEPSASNSTRFRGDKKPKDYSTPIGFVAGGIQQSGKKDKEAEDNGKPLYDVHRNHE